MVLRYWFRSVLLPRRRGRRPRREPCRQGPASASAGVIFGTISDRAAIIALAHSRGVPVVVDQASGCASRCGTTSPRHAIALGADAMVTSAHNVALTQASIIVARTEQLDRDRLKHALDACCRAVGADILASMDVARALLGQTRSVEV